MLKALLPPAAAGGVLFFDGVCGLCNRTLDFLIPRMLEQPGCFQVAPLQGETARQRRVAHGQPDSILFTPVGGGVLSRSQALIAVGLRLGGGWRLLAHMLQLLPQGLADWGYDQLAQRRLRFFAQLPSCRLPRQEERGLFLP